MTTTVVPFGIRSLLHDLIRNLFAGPIIILIRTNHLRFGELPELSSLRSAPKCGIPFERRAKYACHASRPFPTHLSGQSPLYNNYGLHQNLHWPDIYVRLRVSVVVDYLSLSELVCYVRTLSDPMSLVACKIYGRILRLQPAAET